MSLLRNECLVYELLNEITVTEAIRRSLGHHDGNDLFFRIDPEVSSERASPVVVAHRTR